MHQSPAERRTTHRIRLIATDLDGTLLSSENRVLPANRRALAQAVAQRVRLVLVTARKRASTYAVVEQLGLPCACVAHNGGRMWDWQGRELRHLVVDLDLAHAIARFADLHEIPLIMTINEIDYYSATYWSNTAGHQPEDRVIAPLSTALVAPPTRIIVAGSAAIDRVQQAFGAASDAIVVHRYYSREGAIASAMITHPRATKEDALAELVQQIFVQPAEVLAIGDSEADAGMLRWAGLGVAMGNAMPEARAAAQWIAPTHDEAGLAVALERFVLANTEHAPSNEAC